MAKIRLVPEGDLLDPSKPAGALLADAFGHIGAGPPTANAELADAPAGTRYRDTAATLGARDWVKDVTGWRVVAGDTGWRQVPLDAGAATNHPGMQLYLRRLDSTVHASLVETTVSAAGTGATTVCTPPAGFGKGEASTLATGAVVNLASGQPDAAAAVFLTPSGAIRVYRAGALMRGASLTWAAETAWPTVLPGAGL